MHNSEIINREQAHFKQTVLSARPYKPLYVKIKIFYGCNLKCEMCNHWRETRHAPLSMERLYQVIAELAEMGTKKLHISGGEPMLRPQTPELVQTASALGIKVSMTTNGTLITKEKAKQLIEAGLRGVNISIDSPIKKMHEKIRGVAGAFKATTKAVQFFHRYKHKGKLSIRINTVVGRNNYETLATLPDLAHELGADGINLIPIDDHCGEILSMRKKDIEKFNHEIAPYIAERAHALGLTLADDDAFPFGKNEAETHLGRAGRYAFGFYQKHPCYAPWTHTLIDFNGQVYVCCMTREKIPPLGNITQQSFKEIWEGPAYRNIRLNMHPPALSPCARCDDFIKENEKIWSMIGPY